MKQLHSHSIEAVGCAANVGKKAHLEALVNLALEEYAKIDILVSNAAVNPAAGDILDMPESAIDKVLDINIKSAIILAQLVRPHLPKVTSCCRVEIHCLPCCFFGAAECLQ